MTALNDTSTLPQDDRAPHERQRFVEVRNDSGEDIPPFAIMKVTGKVVVDTHRVVTTVDKPDSPLNEFLINGPHTIPHIENEDCYGEGTNDYPAMVASSGSLSAGAFCGPVKDSWLANDAGYGLYCTSDAAIHCNYATVRVIRSKQLIRVKFIVCHQPGDNSTVAVQIENGGDWVDSGVTVQLDDPRRLVFATPGETIVAELVDDGIVQTISEHGLFRRAIAFSSIFRDSYGSIILYGLTSECSAIAHYDWAACCEKIYAGAELWVKYTEDRWRIVTVCCNEGSPSPSDSDSASDSPSGSGSPSASDSVSCFTIPGVDFASLPVVRADELDFVLGVQNGCLVKVQVSPCPQTSASASASASAPPS